ncbi:hypothetical protein BJF78_02110 [Pseudonocardia sp. CNS-139]|nr:hypothetical protein BJF78_02110 [Pseudonocardia sp. CNS-139]
MPSIGSTTHIVPGVPGPAPAPPYSSPTTASPGRSCASRSRTRVSSARSDAVTTSVGVLLVDTPPPGPPGSSHGRGSSRSRSAASVTMRSAVRRSSCGSSGPVADAAGTVGRASVTDTIRPHGEPPGTGVSTIGVASRRRPEHTQLQ